MGGKLQTRVGLVVLGALVVLAAGLFLIGEQNRLFSTKNVYTMTARSVAGLQEGNPVRLNGVTVGLVRDIRLPREATEELVHIELTIEDRYAERIRQDSMARIRTLGLLGDKYVDVTSGSPTAPRIPAGGEIPTAPATDVDKLITSGEDVMDNLVAISHDFRRILGRIDAGEGLIGELTSDSETSRTVSRSLVSTARSLESLSHAIEEGEGPLGRLVRDERLGAELASSVHRLESILAAVEEGDGLLPALLHDEGLEAEVASTLAELRTTSQRLSRWTRQVEEGDGLVPKLLTDEEYGERVSAELEGLVEDLSQAAAKLNRGEGTVARLLDDPQIYEAVNDIVVGVNESRFLRWLIRNRQKKGIEVRYDEAQAGPEGTAGTDEAPEGGVADVAAEEGEAPEAVEPPPESGEAPETGEAPEAVEPPPEPPEE